MGMDPLATWIGSLVLSTVGAAIGAYFTTRAKNLATHDDLDKLVEQVQAVTRETEAIKAEITGGLWDRQKRWEVRRDILLEFMRSAWRLDFALQEFVASCESKPQAAEEQKAWEQIHLVFNCIN